MERAASHAREAGLTGVLVTPGPDLLYFTGYQPIAITERITMLALQDARDPAMIVPVLERPEAEAAPGAATLSLNDWTGGTDPYLAASSLLDPQGTYAISDSAWAMHVLGLQQALPDSKYVSMTSALPMLRAIKDADELERRAAAAAAADATFEQIARLPFAGRRESEIADDLAVLLREHGHSQVDFTVVGAGPNGANPHHEMSERTIEEGDMFVFDFGGIKDGYGSDTIRTLHVGEPSNEEREVYETVRGAQQAGFEAVRPGAEGQEVDWAAARDHGRRLRRAVHPPHRSRHRPDHTRAALHGRGRDPAARAGHMLLDRAGCLPRRTLRCPHRGHRHRHRDRRAAPEQHPARAADRRLT
jgi:Xaa-Pro aminopeptidase